MNTQPLAPLWDDARILDEVTLRVQEQKKWGAIHRICQRIRDDERAALLARVAHHEAQLAEAATRWQPLPDGEYRYPNWDGKYTIVMAVHTRDGWQDMDQGIEGFNPDNIALPEGYRLCRKVSGEGGQDE